MAAVPRSYKKHVAEGGGMLSFAIVFAIIIRIVYWFYFDIADNSHAQGYLWKPLQPHLENTWVSLLCCSLFVGGLAFLASHINTIHVLIRRKTILPPAIIILLFSCHPQFVLMSGEYISVLLSLFTIFLFFGAYNSMYKQVFAFKTGFILALASLFTPVMLIYLPALWIVLSIMRCFSFKAFLASLTGIFVVYVPAFSFYFFTDDMNTFLAPFNSIPSDQIGDFSFLQFDINHWITLGLSVILLIVIITDNYINRHKDKIRTRAYLNLLAFTTIFAILAYLFLNIDPMMNLFMALGSGSLLLSHFFALAEQKGTIVLFYASVAFYFFICFSPFLLL